MKGGDAVDDAIRKRLKKYLEEVKALPNESAKTHRFAQLVAELFPGSNAPIELVQGVEKVVRIQRDDGGEKRGRIDAYYGNAVIEFENSLKATGAHAEEQLREYTSGVWAKGRQQLVCVASDGVAWKSYRPTLREGVKGKPKPGDVTLEPLRTIQLSEDTLDEFWLWLTGLLFRPARTEPTSRRFCIDFGEGSPAFSDAMEALRAAWARVGTQPEPRTAFETWGRYLL